MGRDKMMCGIAMRVCNDGIVDYMNNTNVVVLQDNRKIFQGKFMDYINDNANDLDDLLHLLSEYGKLFDGEDVVICQEPQDGVYTMIRI